MMMATPYTSLWGRGEQQQTVLHAPQFLGNNSTAARALLRIAACGSNEGQLKYDVDTLPHSWH